MSKLILTRHGQSIWNAENRFTGWVDVDLSRKGIEEAEKSGELIKKLNPTEKGAISLEVPLIKNTSKVRNDLIFFVLLITYIFIFNIYKKNNVKK